MLWESNEVRLRLRRSHDDFIAWKTTSPGSAAGRAGRSPALREELQRRVRLRLRRIHDDSSPGKPHLLVSALVAAGGARRPAKIQVTVCYKDISRSAAP